MVLGVSFLLYNFIGPRCPRVAAAMLCLNVSQGKRESVTNQSKTIAFIRVFKQEKAVFISIYWLTRINKLAKLKLH